MPQRLPEPAGYAFGRAPLAAEFGRVVRGRLSHAIFLLRGGGDPAFAVHESRKDIKKVRAALRLVRSSIGREAFRRENDRYRQISRGLSRFRDADAMLECLDDLEDWAEQPHRFSGLRVALMEEARGGRRDGSIRRASARAADALERRAEGIADLPLPGGHEGAEETIEAGVARTYRRGRKRMERVVEGSNDERLHDWRKRAKDLWYQQALLGRDRALAERAHRLSSLLGDDHDLAVLRGKVEANAAEFSWSGEHSRLVDTIVRRRDQLQGEALRVGVPLYADEVPPVLSAELSQASTSPAF